MDFISLVNTYYKDLNDQEKKIIAYLQQLPIPPKEMTSKYLADACFVSRSSVFRLLKKLDLESLAELKYILQKSSIPNEFNAKTNFHQIVQNYHTYIDQIFENLDLTPTIDLLMKTDTLYLYGTGNEQKLEIEMLRQLFTSIGKKVIVFFDKGEYDYLKNSMTANDLLILVSYKGESKEGIELLINSQIRGITRLVFTRTSRNTMAQLADYCLYVPTESIKTPTKLTYEVSTTFYFIIDQLFFGYYDRLERSQESNATKISPK